MTGSRKYLVGTVLFPFAAFYLLFPMLGVTQVTSSPLVFTLMSVVFVALLGLAEVGMVQLRFGASSDPVGSAARFLAFYIVVLSVLVLGLQWLTGAFVVASAWRLIVALVLYPFARQIAAGD